MYMQICDTILILQKSDMLYSWYLYCYIDEGGITCAVILATAKNVRIYISYLQSSGDSSARNQVWFFQNGATLHRLHSLAALGAC
jgi:hypothetical protein